MCFIIQYEVIPIHQKLLWDFISIIHYVYFKNLSQEKESFGGGWFFHKQTSGEKKKKILS